MEISPGTVRYGKADCKENLNQEKREYLPFVISLEPEFENECGQCLTGDAICLKEPSQELREVGLPRLRTSSIYHLSQ